MVAGPVAAWERAQPLLGHFGRAFYMGARAGSGQTMKLINNLLSATAMAISSEAMVMATKAGLDAKQAIDVINAGSGRNTATMDKIPRCVLNRKFDFGFAIGLLNKDVRLCMEEAEAMGLPMVVGSAVRQILAIGTASEGADADMTEMIKVMEGWAGVTVQG
jgi:3-hydroxyisobutyrate dehydrogenase-like beta-hydroxyacid dehydrogenase